MSIPTDKASGPVLDRDASFPMAGNGGVAIPEKTWFGHPVGLFVLFFTEMWERFSFYGMRALLVLYMINYLIDKSQTPGMVLGFLEVRAAFEWIAGPLQSQQLASLVYGWYNGFVYFTPFFGGLLADRILGQRKTVVVGGVLMAIGHFLMAVESLFLLALFFLIIGNGCFKPNVSSQVGNLYALDDPRRDRAFLVFYMGINLGAVIAPLVCGLLARSYGWHYGFAAAGFGMLIGLGVYLLGQRYLGPDQHMKDEATHATAEPLTAAQWKGIYGLGALCLLNIVFWAVYEQQGNTMQVFADKSVDWTIFSWEMPSTWFQSMNPLFILMLAPTLSILWAWQGRNGHEPGSIAKMAIGSAILGGSFLVLMYATGNLQDGQRISFLWLAGCTLIYTIGELYLSPIGLSLVTKVAPPRYVSMLMGMWFMSNFFGNILSGYIGIFYSILSRQSFFLLLCVLGVAAGAAIYALKRPLQRAIGAHL